jgi:biopolymer transport protein ExbB/TolQ
MVEGDMSGLAITAAILLLLACGASGSFALLYRARRIREREAAYGIATPHLQHIGTALGLVGGLIVGGLVLYFLQGTSRFSVIEWVGRSSYMLVAGAAAGHLLILVRTTLQLLKEEEGWVNRGTKRPVQGTLGSRRLAALQRLRRQHKHYVDLKGRDEQLLDELVGVLGTPLLNMRSDLSRIPFYGYLGTVCGILLMAEELGRINEATETFRVLSAMATGLVLAFQTTLVALLTFLPLRKLTDYLIRRLGRVEDAWTLARDEVRGGGGGEGE